MKSIIQVHLEYKKDVIRDIEINPTSNLEELHKAIVSAYELDKNQLASFYITNDKFELLQEIPLFSVEDKENSMLGMSDIILSSILKEEGAQLLYVYDFMKMWRFLITLTEISDEEITTAVCINALGDMPEDAPEIIFKAEKEFDPFGEAFDDFDEFKENEEEY
tara:strand:- start:82 stop:573 length:492 start_codon:yes stop_codon:yes gene_type:complete